MSGSPRRNSYDAFKRILDVVAAVVGLVLLSPVMAVVAVLVVTNLGRPALFRQDRPGRGGNIFRLYKFRTMKNRDPANGLVTDGQRLTRLGLALRSTSLDELPTLVNVLKGDMSIVGPRPLLVKYLERYTPSQARRHDVRPGITGLAQVNGRNALNWEGRFQLDVEYVDARSPLLDLRILARTAIDVVMRRGISGEDTPTMTEFVVSRSSEQLSNGPGEEHGKG